MQVLLLASGRCVRTLPLFVPHLAVFLHTQQIFSLSHAVWSKTMCSGLCLAFSVLPILQPRAWKPNRMPKKSNFKKRAAGFPHSSEAILGYVEALLTLDAYLLCGLGLCKPLESGAFAVNLQLLAVGWKITALEVPDVVTDPGMSLVLGRGGISSFLGGDDSRKNWHWLSICVD